jgi:cystine transport system substrate-binding protein
MRFPARRELLIAPWLGRGRGDGPGRLRRQDRRRPESGLKRVEATKTLRIGLEGTYPPFNFQDKDGQLAGFEVDFAKALAAQMGVKPSSTPRLSPACWGRWSPNASTW